MKQSIYPPKECPRYPSCSVNHCPLDPDSKDRLPHAGDKQTKCTIEKGVRQRIGSKYAAILPLCGLTPREAAGARTWAKYPVARQWAIKEAARDRIKAVNARKHRIP